MDSEGGDMIKVYLDLNVPSIEGESWEKFQESTIALLKRHLEAMEYGISPLEMLGSVSYGGNGQIQWSVEGEVTECQI